MAPPSDTSTSENEPDFEGKFETAFEATGFETSRPETETEFEGEFETI